MGRRFLAVVLAALTVAGCSSRDPSGPGEMAATSGTSNEKECLVRAMYFESNRSSHEGLMAVGTVVMNRVASHHFPNTICGVVGQKRQFAPGVLARRLDPKQRAPAERAADAILAGERYAPVGKAMHFHMASFKNPFPARYVTVAGGNAFYLRPGRRLRDDTAGTVANRLPEEKSTSASSETTLANAASETFLQRLYKNAVERSPASTACANATSLGAISLACETETEGR